MTRLPLPEFYRRVAVDAAAANDKPLLRLFRVTIGDNEPLTISAEHSFAAREMASEAVGSPDVRIEVQALGPDAKVEPFPIAIARNAVAGAELRDAYLTNTEAGAFAIVPGTQLSEAEAAEVDRQYHAKKVSGGLRRQEDAHALDLQVQFQGYIGSLS
jgi:hypothetical protein